MNVIGNTFNLMLQTMDERINLMEEFKDLDVSFLQKNQRRLKFFVFYKEDICLFEAKWRMSPSSAQKDLNEVAAPLKSSRAGKMAHLTRKFSEQLDEFNSLQESYVQSV